MNEADIILDFIKEFNIDKHELLRHIGIGSWRLSKLKKAGMQLDLDSAVAFINYAKKFGKDITLDELYACHKKS